MKHIIAATREVGLPRMAGLIEEDICDALREISHRLAEEAGCPQSKKDQIVDLLFDG